MIECNVSIKPMSDYRFLDIKLGNTVIYIDNCFMPLSVLEGGSCEPFY